MAANKPIKANSIAIIAKLRFIITSING